MRGVAIVLTVVAAFLLWVAVFDKPVSPQEACKREFSSELKRAECEFIIVGRRALELNERRYERAQRYAF